MFSLKKFFYRDEKFFDLIEALAESSSSSVKTMSRMLSHQEEFKSVDEVIQKKRKSKELNDKIAHELCVSFITPFEREDIEALASALTKISKTAEKFVSQYVVFRNVLQPGEFQRQSDLLIQLADILVQMVKKLRHKPDVDAIRVLNDQLRAKEAESDTIMLTLLKDMYKNVDEKKLSALLSTKNLQELLEKLTDRFRDAGNIIFRIVLKYA